MTKTKTNFKAPLTFDGSVFHNEDELRKFVAAHSAGRLRYNEWYYSDRTGSTFPGSRLSTDLGDATPGWSKLKKADLVEVYVKHILAHATEYKDPASISDLDEFKSKVVEEVMAYSGCYEGKATWLAKLGIKAPPRPVRVTITVEVDSDVVGGVNNRGQINETKVRQWAKDVLPGHKVTQTTSRFI